ncbi:MAG: DUF4831 family protein [Cytophagales bacterium]|nr:DUF4831 family protein [Cytophagales bacterium]
MSCCSFAGDAQTLQKMLDELQRQEDDIIAAFAGSVETKMINQRFDVTPTANATVNLFSYDASNGFTMLRRDTLNAWNPKFDGTGVTHTVSVAFQNYSDHLVKYLNAAPSDADGLTYRLPGIGLIKVSEDASQKLIKQMSINQFGPVISLPRKLNSSKLEYFTNGAISKLALVSNSIKPEDIEKVGTTISSVHDQFKKKEPEPVDELADLERQRKILEEKVKINELNKKISDN